MTRSCYICLLEVEEAQVVEDEWVSPCRCSGTIAWVHRTCVMRWVHMQERSAAGLRCPSCQTPYVLTPERGPVLRAKLFLDKYILPGCRLYISIIAGMVFIDTGCIAAGIYTLAQVYGVDEAIARVHSSEVLQTVMELHLISYSVFFIFYVPLDHLLLRVLQGSSRLPVLGWVFPSDMPRRYRMDSMDRQIYDTLSPVVSAVLLPPLAAAVGRLCFSSVESDLKRFLLGGFAVLALKSTVMMYCMQKLMVRRKKMRILPYDQSRPPVENQS